MIRAFDKLNRPTAVLIALVLLLVVNGFLAYYHYRSTEKSAAAEPSSDIALSANRDREDDGFSEQEDEPGDAEIDDVAEQPEGEKQGVLGTQETEPEPAPVLTPDPPASTPPPATAKDPAVSPAPVPTPPYLEPVYEEKGDDYRYTYE
jgi:hypothetical protein